MNDMRRVHAEQLMSSLELSLPPVAIAFCDVVPDDVPMFEGVVPAGCAFWPQATARTFATAARDHALCAIGIHTHNLSGAAASQPDELQASLKAMMGLDYVREEEIAAIPVMQDKLAHALYGPLADFPVQPEVVLVFAHAQHGLILSEAVARVDGGTPPAMGRPACAIVPHVLNQRRAAMSLGCCGARAYLDALTDDVALWALPAHCLDQYCEQIAAFADANRTLTAFHERRRQDVESGQRPTVRTVARAAVGASAVTAVRSPGRRHAGPDARRARRGVQDDLRAEGAVHAERVASKRRRDRDRRGQHAPDPSSTS